MKKLENQKLGCGHPYFFNDPTFRSHSRSDTIGTLALFNVLDQSPASFVLPHPDKMVLSQPPYS